jgi:hypothetical protein
MATSILLFLALLPVQLPSDSCLPGSRARQTALSALPFDEQDPLYWRRAEAVDEEEEKFDGQQPAYRPLDEVSDVSRLFNMRGSSGSPRLPTLSDRDLRPRGPP